MSDQHCPACGGHTNPDTEAALAGHELIRFLEGVLLLRLTPEQRQACLHAPEGGPAS